jgi:hypothetical protein
MLFWLLNWLCSRIQLILDLQPSCFHNRQHSCMQLDMDFSAASGSSGSANAITDASLMAVEIEKATTSATFPLSIMSSPIIEKTFVCGDSICSPGEPSTTNVDPIPGVTCMEDCPVVLGPCPTPGSGELGNISLQCGGNGNCMPATRSCACNYGYAGDACSWCSGTHREVNGKCEVMLSALAPLPPPGTPTTPGTRVCSAICTHEAHEKTFLACSVTAPHTALSRMPDAREAWSCMICTRALAKHADRHISCLCRQITLKKLTPAIPSSGSAERSVWS